MRFKLRGRFWNFIRQGRLPDDAYGLCDKPTIPNKSIKIKQSLKGEEELNTIIHEMMHACIWDLDEEAVDETATDIARALWKLGYRKTDGDI